MYSPSYKKSKRLTVCKTSNGCFDVEIARLKDQGYIIFASKGESLANERNLCRAKEKAAKPPSASNKTKLIHQLTMCADKQRNKHTSVLGLAEVPWSAKFKSARTRPLLVSKKSFRFPTGKKNETQFGILSPRFRRKGVVFPGKRKSYKPCLAEFFFAIFNGDIGAGVAV